MALVLAVLLILPLCARAEMPAYLGYTAVTSSGVRMTALSVRESRGGWSAPAAGRVFVLVSFRAENGSRGDLTLSSVMDFELWADGVRQDWSQAAMWASACPIDGTLASGRQTEGEVGWEVPEDWSCLEIYCRPGGSGTALEFILYRGDMR